MASQDALIATTRSTVNQVLNKIEEAQATAAALVQEYNKLGGATFLSGHDWTGSDITEQQFLDAVNSLSTALPDILGAHGTNLYTAKW